MQPSLRPAALALALAAALPAFAQEPTPAQLDSITVTAQRRAEDPQKIPLAITTVSAEKLDILGSGGEDIRFLPGACPASTSNPASAARFRVSTSADWATATSISTPRSRSR
jgi:outer membrane receptor protein involved in Fe transport